MPSPGLKLDAALLTVPISGICVRARGRRMSETRVAIRAFSNLVLTVRENVRLNRYEIYTR
jgi:hypothetical protein